MELIYLMFCHYIADFCLQTENQAKNKSSNILKLLEHTYLYSLFMLLTSLLFFTQLEAMIFGLSCFILHTITDFVSSRLSEIQYQKQKMNGIIGFWSIIGMDQFLHFVQIYLTYEFLRGTI